MALGAANNSAQARGKNKATKRRKAKEVDAAASYTEIQASAVQGSFACSQSTLNVTYYHDGSHVSGLPLTAGDKVYTSKRVNSRFYPANGHIKVGPDRGRYSNIEVTDGAVRAPGATTCP